MKDEILIHKKQSVLDDYLQIENELCLTCRWGINGVCENGANENFKELIINIDLKECEHRYSIYDDEVLMSKYNNEDSLF